MGSAEIVERPYHRPRSRKAIRSLGARIGPYLPALLDGVVPPRRRPLGRSRLSIAPFALGGNVFGWTVSQAEGFRLLDAFVSAGYNLIDTADVYSNWAPGNQGGESERLIGDWLRRSGRRNDVVLAT